MSYTTSDRVQRHLGVAFTADQAAECFALLPAASAWIDTRTARTWAGASVPVVGELHPLYGDWLYLDKPPVSAVTSVEVRPSTTGAAWTATPAGGWELVNPATGHLLLPWGYAGWWARVGYTPAQTVDPRVSLAATLLVAHWLTPLLSSTATAGIGVPPGAGITGYQVGDVRVSYGSGASAASATASAAAAALGVPAEVLGLVDPLREVVLA